MNPRLPYASKHTETRANERKNDRLGKQLPDNAAPAGPYGRAHSKLMLAGRASREQQNGDVAAPNGQQQPYGAKKQIEGFAYLVQSPNSSGSRWQSSGSALDSDRVFVLRIPGNRSAVLPRRLPA